MQDPTPHLSTGHQTVAPGSQSALRALNEERIAEILEEHGPATQAQLARISGLSPASVSNIVRSLIDAGLARKQLTTSSGRRAYSVSLLTSRHVAVGVDIGRRHIRLIAAAKNREILSERFVPLPVGHMAEKTLAVAESEFRRLLADADRQAEDVIGVGVGIPGPIDQRTNTVVEGAILPEWVGIDLITRLKEAFGTQVSLQNDANLGALGEAWFGEHRGSKNLIYVKVATGIGSGIVVQGELLEGALGISGEIGHVGLQSSDVICQCGNRGCLETVASTKTILEQLRQAGRHVSKSEDIVELSDAGDVATHRFLEDAARATGEACANLANVLGPELIVLGGPLASLEETFLKPLEAAVRRHAMPLISENVQIAASSRGDQTEALGGVALILRGN